MKWKNTLLVVSHDQDFLNAVCTDVIHVYQTKLEYYRGNYDNFKHVFTERINQKRKDYDKRKKLLQQAQAQKSKKQDQTKKLDQVKNATKVLRNKQIQSMSKHNKKDKEEQGSADSKLEELEIVPRVCI